MMRAKVAGVLCALAGVGVMVAGAGPAGAETEDRIPVVGASTKAVDACAASFPADAFAKVASVADVTPGQPVAVDVTWRPAWYSGDTVDVLGCVAANGRFVDGSVARGVDTSTGLWVHKFAVPANAAKDIAVCQAAVVFSEAKATRSDPDCFTVTAASTGEATPAPEAANPSAGAGKETAVTAPAPPPVAAAAPAATTPAPRTAAAAPAPKPATAATAATAATGVPTTQLPHTGAAERLLVAVAGIMLAFGGWALGFGAGRRRTFASAIRSTLQ